MGIALLFLSIVVPASPTQAAKCNDDFISLNSIAFWTPCADVCSGNPVLIGTDNREKIWNYLIGTGFSAEQTAGILGNLQSESAGTFSPTVNEFSAEFGEGGYGIAQWTHDPGRRGNLVQYMRDKNPELMTKYYNAAYSTPGESYTSAQNGFVAKNADTGELMPVDDNDKLLLSQLDFLLVETSDRLISPSTASKVSGISVGSIEVEAIKSVKTIEEASNIWVYNFEIPANIDETAKARVINAEAIYKQYSGQDAPSCKASGDLRSRIVSIAEQEYARWQSGELGPGDYGKYTYDVGYDWCAAFVSWVLKEAGKPVPVNPRFNQPVWTLAVDWVDRGDTMGMTTYTRADNNYTPRPGDIATYGSAHVNLVVAVEGGKVITIGGNEIGEHWSNSVVNKEIYGYGNTATYYTSVD